jgi:hypothetical protein
MSIESLRRSIAATKDVAYFNTGWSMPDYPYGINLTKPRFFAAVVRECFAKPVDWFVTLDDVDQAGRPLVIRAMTDSWGGGNKALEGYLRRFLKERQDFPLGPFMFGQAVTLHLLGSIYGTDGYAWDPYVPTAHVAANFRGGGRIINLAGNDNAPIYFKDSMSRISQL